MLRDAFAKRKHASRMRAFFHRAGQRSFDTLAVPSPLSDAFDRSRLTLAMPNRCAKNVDSACSNVSLAIAIGRRHYFVDGVRKSLIGRSHRSMWNRSALRSDSAIGLPAGIFSGAE